MGGCGCVGASSFSCYIEYELTNASKAELKIDELTKTIEKITHKLEQNISDHANSEQALRKLESGYEI